MAGGVGAGGTENSPPHKITQGRSGMGFGGGGSILALKDSARARAELPQDCPRRARERHELRLAEPTLRELFRKPVVRKQIGRLGGWQYHVEAAEF